jgi:hypothetical protein
MPTLIDTFGLPINIPLHKSEVGTTVVPFSVSSCRSVFSCVGFAINKSDIVQTASFQLCCCMEKVVNNIILIENIKTLNK